MENDESEGSKMKKVLSLMTAIMLVCVAFAQDQAKLVLLSRGAVVLTQIHDGSQGGPCDPSTKN